MPWPAHLYLPFILGSPPSAKTLPFILGSPPLGKNPKMTYWEPTLLKMATPKQFESATPLLSESLNTIPGVPDTIPAAD